MSLTVVFLFHSLICPTVLKYVKVVGVVDPLLHRRRLLGDQHAVPQAEEELHFVNHYLTQHIDSVLSIMNFKCFSSFRVDIFLLLFGILLCLLFIHIILKGETGYIVYMVVERSVYCVVLWTIFLGFI